MPDLQSFLKVRVMITVYENNKRKNFGIYSSPRLMFHSIYMCVILEISCKYFARNEQKRCPSIICQTCDCTYEELHVAVTCLWLEKQLWCCEVRPTASTFYTCLICSHVRPMLSFLLAVLVRPTITHLLHHLWVFPAGLTSHSSACGLFMTIGLQWLTNYSTLAKSKHRPNNSLRKLMLL